MRAAWEPCGLTTRTHSHTLGNVSSPCTSAQTYFRECVTGCGVATTAQPALCPGSTCLEAMSNLHGLLSPSLFLSCVFSMGHTSSHLQELLHVTFSFRLLRTVQQPPLPSQICLLWIWFRFPLPQEHCECLTMNRVGNDQEAFCGRSASGPQGRGDMIQVGGDFRVTQTLTFTRH